MTKQEILNHPDYNSNSHINKLWSEFDGCYYIIIETSNSFEVSKQI